MCVMAIFLHCHLQRCTMPSRYLKKKTQPASASTVPSPNHAPRRGWSEYLSDLGNIARPNGSKNGSQFPKCPLFSEKK